ncbi:MAG: DUF2703 domain-containing protein [Peptococcaceae bacterium]|nr:DUF2703 domain-containing protein [Peptococcaceae bacterium]
MSKNWYPVINTETCIDCGTCINYCAHGVYDKNSPQKPFVVYTNGCIDQCHGCGNLCPTGSITYAGDNTGWTPPNQKISDTSKTDSECSIDCSYSETTMAAKPTTKKLNIDFLYLDLNTCERCMATDETLQKALGVLSPGYLKRLAIRQK